MESVEEPIKTLLERTGWSVEDLLHKLEKIKKTDTNETDNKKIEEGVSIKKLPEKVFIDLSDDDNIENDKSATVNNISQNEQIVNKDSEKNIKNEHFGQNNENEINKAVNNKNDNFFLKNYSTDHHEIELNYNKFISSYDTSIIPPLIPLGITSENNINNVTKSSIIENNRESNKSNKFEESFEKSKDVTAKGENNASPGTKEVPENVVKNKINNTEVIEIDSDSNDDELVVNDCKTSKEQTSAESVQNSKELNEISNFNKETFKKKIVFGRTKHIKKLSPNKNIREKIQEQLSNLRKKIIRPVFVDKPTTLITCSPTASTNKVNDEIINKKTSLKMSDKLFEKFCETSSTTKEESTDLIQPVAESTEHISSSSKSGAQDELNFPDFVITNVMGGYKSPEESNNEFSETILKTENFCEEKLDIKLEDLRHEPQQSVEPILPKKTTDVTKIKGWQKKKFILPDTEPKNNDSVKDLNVPVKGNPGSRESVFVSDSLDQYLNENSKLNISYEVPKLIAETTVTKPPLEQLPLTFKKLLVTGDTTKTTVAEYKPKTLAEKRKFLESQMLEKQKNSEDIKSLVSYIKTNFKEGPLIYPDIPFSRKLIKEAKNRSLFLHTLMYNRKRLRVISSSSVKTVGRIIDDFGFQRTYNKKNQGESKYKENQTSKPSLLESLKKTEICHVRYKPGPLSRKVKLQKNLQDTWTTTVVNLPRLYVEVEPFLGKPVHPRVRELIKNDDVILDNDKINFALSALKNGDEKSIIPPLKFVFPLTYANNQKNLIVRRKIVKTEPLDEEVTPTITPIDDENKTTEDIVQNILERMLDYVDTKEIEQGLIKDDPDSAKTSEVEVNTTPLNTSIGKNVGAIIKNTTEVRKNLKTSRELKRLNVKIIEVNVEDQLEMEEGNCEKEYCRMGCVCGSLQCKTASLIPDHCGREECMIECSCNIRKNNRDDQVTLPVGTNLFSAHVMNHLQDVATKDLAKVEKQFTQTVIKAYNQTIVVGTDPKERSRRASKFPKRYAEFDGRGKDLEMEVSGEIPLKNCVVKLQKCDFNIIPFCMVHELYNCHCSGNSIKFEDKKPFYTPSIIVNRPKPSAKHVIRSKDGRNELEIRTGDVKNCICRRTVAVPSNYYIRRNKSNSHLRKIFNFSRRLVMNRDKYFANKTVAIPELLSSRYDYKNVQAKRQLPMEIEDFEHVLKKLRKSTNENDNSNETVQNSDHFEHVLKKLRKSTNENDSSNETVENTDHFEHVLKKLRKSTNENDNSNETVQITDPLKSKPVSDNATVQGIVSKPIEYDLIQDLQKNKKTLDKNLLLMPWKSFRIKFYNGSVSVYASTDISCSEILVASSPLSNQTQYVNIQDPGNTKNWYKKKNYIINWLLMGLPSHKVEDNLLVILSISPNNENACKICGVCEKLGSSHQYRLIQNGDLKTNFCYSAKNLEQGLGVSIPIDLTSEGENKIKSNIELHKNQSNEKSRKRVLLFSRHKYKKESLFVKNKQETKEIDANLPHIEGGCRWRLIDLTNSFTYLYFVRSNYSIRYIDLLKAPSMVADSEFTINLKSNEMRKNYCHPKFGIFCMANSTKQVFVGPYDFKENHDLEILTYMNGALVNSDLYNKLKESTAIPIDSGLWCYQDGDNMDIDKDDDDIQIIQDPAPCIDLTEVISDNEESVPNEKEDEKGTESGVKVKSEEGCGMSSNVATNVPLEKEKMNEKLTEPSTSLNKNLMRKTINATVSNVDLMAEEGSGMSSNVATNVPLEKEKVNEKLTEPSTSLNKNLMRKTINATVSNVELMAEEGSGMISNVAINVPLEKEKINEKLTEPSTFLNNNVLMRKTINATVNDVELMAAEGSGMSSNVAINVPLEKEKMNEKLTEPSTCLNNVLTRKTINATLSDDKLKVEEGSGMSSNVSTNVPLEKEKMNEKLTEPSTCLNNVLTRKTINATLSDDKLKAEEGSGMSSNVATNVPLEKEKMNEKLTEPSTSLNKILMRKTMTKMRNAAIPLFNNFWKNNEDSRFLLVSNVKDLGSIKVVLGYTYRVMCPIECNVKKFKRIEAAIKAMESNLNEVFIRVPSSFRIKLTAIKPKPGDEKLLKPIDRKILNGEYIVNENGVTHKSESPLIDIKAHSTEESLNSGKSTKYLLVNYQSFSKELLRISAASQCKDTKPLIESAIREIIELQKKEIQFKDEKVMLQLKKTELEDIVSKIVNKTLEKEKKEKSSEISATEQTEEHESSEESAIKNIPPELNTKHENSEESAIKNISPELNTKNETSEESAKKTIAPELNNKHENSKESAIKNISPELNTKHETSEESAIKNISPELNTKNETSEESAKKTIAPELNNKHETSEESAIKHIPPEINTKNETSEEPAKKSIPSGINTEVSVIDMTQKVPSSPPSESFNKTFENFTKPYPGVKANFNTSLSLPEDNSKLDVTTSEAKISPSAIENVPTQSNEEKDANSLQSVDKSTAEVPNMQTQVVGDLNYCGSTQGLATSGNNEKLVLLEVPEPFGTSGNAKYVTVLKRSDTQVPQLVPLNLKLFQNRQIM